MPEAAKKEDEQTELNLEALVDDANKTQKDVLITLDATGKELKTESAGADGSAGDQPKPDDIIADLKKQIEDAKARDTEKQDRISKLEAEQQAQVKKVTAAVDNEFKARETSVESSLSAAKNELDSIKRQLKTARETGDIDKEIELEEKLADTRYQYNATLWQKNNLAELKKAQEERAKAVVQTQNPDGTRKFSTREQKWVDEHPRYSNDEDYQALVWSLDSQAKRKGIIPDTDAYYDFLNTRLEKMYPTEGTQTVTVPAKTSVAASTAAPIGRGGGTSSSGAGASSVTQIRLTQEQLEAAEFMGMSPVEYAQDLINQQKEKGR